MVENLIPLTSPSETGENTEGSQTQNLETATVEPQAFVEQTGNFQQSEAIQSSLTTVVNNVAATQEGTTTQGAPAGSGENTTALLTPNAEVAVNAPANQEGTTVQTSQPEVSDLNTTQEASIALVTPDAEVTVNAPANQEGTTAQAAQPEVSDLSTTRETSPGAGGDTAAVDPTPLPNEAMGVGEQQVGSSIGDIRTISGLTPIQMPMPGPDDGGGDTGSVPPNPLPHIDPGMTTGMMTRVVEEPRNGPAIVERHTTGSRGLDQAQLNEAISAYTGSVEVLATGTVREVRAGQPGRFDNRDEVPLAENAKAFRTNTAGFDDSSKAVDTASTQDAGEGDEGWIPPDVYIYITADGKITIVDASGKPVDSPPIVTSPDGIHYYAYYPGITDESGHNIMFEIHNYSNTLNDLYLYQDSSGKMIVVDANGRPVDSPPILTSPDGKTIYASYPGTGEVELPTYHGSLSDLYLYQDSSGKMIVVDANGKPVDSQPILTSPDGKTIYASYPGTGEVELPTYHSSLSDLYLYKDSNGNMIVVDANGKPVDSPPKLTSSDGVTFYASYPGTGDVKLPTYDSSLNHLYLYHDSDGNLIVVDANGKPIDSPPIISTPDGIHFYASYPGSGRVEHYHSEPSIDGPEIIVDDNGKILDGVGPLELPTYQGSLDNLYLYKDSSGKLNVVDANGKPVSCPPMLTSPDGINYFAYYPTGSHQTGPMVQLQYYKPPSASAMN